MPMRKIYAITAAAALYTRTLSFDPDPEPSPPTPVAPSPAIMPNSFSFDVLGEHDMPDLHDSFREHVHRVQEASEE